MTDYVEFETHNGKTILVNRNLVARLGISPSMQGEGPLTSILYGGAYSDVVKGTREEIRRKLEKK